MRIIGAILLFVSGITFGMFGLDVPMNFEKAIALILFVLGVALLFIQELID